MRFLLLLEMVLTAAFLLFMLTQVIWPLLTNRPIFWLLRGKSPQKQIDALTVEIELERARREADDLRRKLEDELQKNRDNLSGMTGVRGQRRPSRR